MNEMKLTTGQFATAIFFPVMFPALMLLIGGNWFWSQMWVWGIWFVAYCWLVTAYLYFYDPALLKERFQPLRTDNQKKDAAYLIFLIGFLFLTWIFILPLDAERFGWSPHFPLSVEVIGGVLLLGASFFMWRAFADNTFASPLIRIQKERKQTVVTTGVYGFVRHPMYLGALLLFIGTPLLLGSMWGLVIGGMLIYLMGIRAVGEEKMLVNELEGYAEYSRHKVRYRFIPFIW